MGYICKNIHCEMCDIDDTPIKDTISIVDGEIVRSGQICPACGEMREKAYKWDGGGFNSPGNKNVSNK